MKILHLSTTDIDGGAARSAYRLHVGLRQLGHESRMLVAHKKSDDPDVTALARPMDILNRLSRRIRHTYISRSFERYRQTRPKGYESFTDDRSSLGASLARQLPRCDVMHLRWVPRFIGYQEFFASLPPRIPVVWTLDDMNPLTGGCHFDDGCGKFLSGCGACPQLGSAEPRDLSHQIWNRKRRVFGALDPSRLHMVATNRWMEELIRRSPFFNKFSVSTIPYGLDTDMFRPRPKTAARSLLGLPEDAFVILFVAFAVGLRRKGLSFLADALREPIGENAVLLSIGNGAPNLNLSMPAKHIDKVDNDWVLSCIYSAADVFVCPSLQDNLPNTVMEAMACGTPVVAFDAGGIPDMVRPEITGLLAATGDTRGLREGMARLQRDRAKGEAMGQGARAVALREYSLGVQARRYAELYAAMLGTAAAETMASFKTEPAPASS